MGTSYASKRQEAIQQLTQLIQAMPQLGQIAGDIIARNLDVDGAEEIAKRAKMMLPPGMLQMEQDGGEGGQPAMPPQPPPDPLAEMQQQGQAQAMQFELESAQAKAEQEKAKVEQEKAKAEGAHIDNALKLKKLREPQVEPGQAGF